MMCSVGPVRAGGGWLLRRGHGFIKINQSMLRAQRYFTPDGRVTPITTTSLYGSSLYAEYGLADRWQVMAYLPFFTRVTLNRQVSSATKEEIVPGDQLNAVGDTDVGLKFGILQKTRIKVAASLVLGLPVGNPAGGNTQLLQTGDGEFNQIFLVEASQSLYPLPVFFSAGTGINVRSNGFSEEFRYYVQGGVSLKNALYVICQLSGVESFRNGSPKGVANSIFSNNTEYVSVEPSLLWQIHPHFGVSASAALPLRGQQVLATTQFGAGVFLNW